MGVFLFGDKMICERVDKRFEKTVSARLAFVRTICLFLPIVFVFSLLLFSGVAFAAGCANPGKDGVGTPTGVANTYYPGTSSVSAGATSIPVGSSSGSATPIAAGDLLLIIQMQDADISYSNDSNYGGSGAGSGYTNLNQTGYYEYAVAAGAVSGGYVSITGGLTYSYRYRAASSTNGQSTYQVIRVPQYSSATVSSTVSALNWNGSVGGIMAIDVAGTLTLSGTITADGAGFRGGFGRGLTGGAGANTDYRTSYLVNTNASKGEGIAGSPYYMNRPATFNGAPAVVTTYGSGYPDGASTNASYARGAPGNAGGGGTDGHPSANDQNSGGGGGGNYAAGAKGGNSWSSNLTVGGEGGSAVSGIAFNRVVMGGGGGAGTTNNSTADNTTYTDPAGLACSLTTGACSSGAPGGGIIILRANYITGGGTITANGGSGYNVANDSGGGGGAGGSLIIYTYAGGSVAAYVNGGDGGNAWRSQAPGTPYPGERHGPGGGGSGGFIAYSPSTLGISMTYNAGVSGKTTTADDIYGSSSSSGGYATFNSPDPPGVLPGAQCVPDLSTSTKTLVDLNGGEYEAGDTLQYTITIKETKGIAASSVSVTDTIDTNLTGLTITSCPSGATCSYGAGVLSATGISIPANGSVTIVYTVIISSSATPGTTISNTANITTPSGPVATSAPMVTVSGYTSGMGTKLLYLYDGTSSPAWKLSRTPNTTSANYANINSSSQTWTMNLAAAAAITISQTVSATVPVTLYLRRDATTGNRSVTVNLQCSSGGTILTQTRTLTLSTTPTAYTFNLPISAPLTCGQGNTWNLTVSTSTALNTRVYPQSGGNPSHVDLPATTVINVNSIGFYNATWPGGSVITSVAPGATVYIRAVVSDPFGSYDIVNAPTITIKNPNGTTIVSAAAMTYEDTGTETPSLTKTYEYSYTVPSSPTGNWSVSVKAMEGMEGTVTNTAYATMPVVIPPPVLTIVKLSDKASVVTGDIITYTANVTNTGAGTAASVVMTDSLSSYVQVGLNSYGAGVAFQFVNGTPASGLTLGTPVYSNDNGSTWVYTPVSGGGGAPAGYDGNITNWRIPMSGTMNANGANFTINYKVRVK
jgi:uncharacterized repeat protein (TIGR01451 family)